MAERIGYLLANRLSLDFTASSAGIGALVGNPMHPDAATVVEKLGADASGFRARQLTPRVASDADLVLTMTKEHRGAVLELAPRQLRRTYTLREAAVLITQFEAKSFADMASLRPYLPADEPLDITDPIGCGPEVFAEVGAEIARLLPPVMELCQRSTVE